MKNFKNNPAAETLIETLIAVSMFMVIIAPAAMMYSSNFRLLSATRNNAIAANLANEGIEIVRNFRDTNFLRFPDKAQQCWNTMPEKTDQSTCESPANKIGDENNTSSAQNFRLTLNLADFSWKLEEENGASLDPANGDTLKYRLKKDAGTDVYFSGDAAGEDTPFYRQISIQYINIGGASKLMKVTSLVQYQSSAGKRNIKRELFLSN